MKTRLVFCCLLAAGAAHSASAADLVVKVTDVRKHEGRLTLAVYDSADAWDGKAKAVAMQTLDADADTLTFRFTDLAAGTYAVAAMHDENGNGRLDSNFLGMPVEGYGFSNNPKVMRRATFEEAAVAVGADGADIELRLR